MRTVATTMILLAACCAPAWEGAAAAEAPADQAAQLVVRKVVGAALGGQGGGWTALRVGEELKPGVLVRTGNESRVELACPHTGITLSLLQDSTVSVNKLNVRKTEGEVVCDHELELKAGRMESEVIQLAPTSKFEVKVPDGVMGVRRKGTRFSLGADFALSVERGSVVMVYVNEKKSGTPTLVLVVDAGQQFNPASLKVEPMAR